MDCQTFKQTMTSSLAMQWHLVGCTLQTWWLLFTKRSYHKKKKLLSNFLFSSLLQKEAACLKDLFPTEGKTVDGVHLHTRGVKRHEVNVFLPAKGRYFHSRKGKLALRLPVLRCGQVEGFGVDAIHPVPLSNATETHQTLQDTHIRHTYTQVNTHWKGKKERTRETSSDRIDSMQTACHKTACTQKTHMWENKTALPGWSL